MMVERRATVVGGYRVRSVHAGKGPPVVLLHGLSGSHRWWLDTLPALAARFRVHVPELFGHGASRPACGLPDMDGLARLLERWLEATGIPRADLVGHSMGGQVLVHLAAARPQRVARLVLVSASGVPRPHSLGELVRVVTELSMPHAWTRTDFVRTIVSDALRTGPRVLACAAWRILSDDVRPLLPRIPSRTLLVWGAGDALTPLEQAGRMATALPDAELVVLPNAAHIPMIEQPDAFNAALLRFLSAA